MARRKMSLPNRIINAALFALAFARPIQLFLKFGAGQTAVNALISESTFGLASSAGVGGKFNLAEGMKMYGPALASFVLFEIKKMAMKKFRF